MNILLIISKNDKYGAQRVFLEQVIALHQMKHSLIVVGRGDKGYIPEGVQALGLPYYGIPMKGLKDLLYLRSLVKQNNIDIIHTALDRADYFGVILSRLTSVPVVSTMNVRRYHIGYRFADRVVTVSNKQKALLLKNGVPDEKIRVIRPGIDVERYSNPVSEKQEYWKRKLNADLYSIVFCHISSIIPQKNHVISIELTGKCKKNGENPLLIIAGDPVQGDYYDSLISKITDNGLGKNVYFTGWTSDLPELLSLSHFTLLPSVHEAFGMVLLEGMAAGTPIIAREDEGGAELIEEYGTGFLYSPAPGVPALAERLLSLWHDRPSYGALSDRCREIAKREFTTEQFGKRLDDMYTSLLSGSY